AGLVAAAGRVRGGVGVTRPGASAEWNLPSQNETLPVRPVEPRKRWMLRAPRPPQLLLDLDRLLRVPFAECVEDHPHRFAGSVGQPDADPPQVAAADQLGCAAGAVERHHGLAVAEQQADFAEGPATAAEHD